MHGCGENCEYPQSEAIILIPWGVPKYVKPKVLKTRFDEMATSLEQREHVIPSKINLSTPSTVGSKIFVMH